MTESRLGKLDDARGDDRNSSDPGPQAALPEVVQVESCSGFLVSADGRRFRLEMQDATDRTCMVELPVAALNSLMKVLPEVQQRALPRASGNSALRVVRQAASWSLERDIADDALTLVLQTAEGYEWCFTLADTDVFSMAECLREERTVTLPAPPGRQ